MELRLNYDFFNKVNQLKDSSTEIRFRLMKERSKRFLRLDLPIFTMICIMLGKSFAQTLAILVAEYALCMGLVNINGIIDSEKYFLDRKTKNSEYELIALASKLNELNINTYYNLLLSTELCDKKTKLVLNDYHLPDLSTTKYINIPAYDNEGNIENVSIVQEHIIGAKQYILKINDNK